MRVADWGVDSQARQIEVLRLKENTAGHFESRRTSVGLASYVLRCWAFFLALAIPANASIASAVAESLADSVFHIEHAETFAVRDDDSNDPSDFPRDARVAILLVSVISHG